MNRFSKCLRVISFGLLLTITSVYAKRLSPPPVPPVILNGVEYSAVFSNWTTPPGGGFIEARIKATKKLLWRKQVYTIVYNPNLETDIQDIYITKIAIENGNLLIGDEKGRNYLLNLMTHEMNLILPPKN